MSKKTIPSDDKPIANITIYRLDIYRLLSLLWADEKITKNHILQSLSNDHCESEVNRLLILTAVVTRQILDNANGKYNAIEDRKCGEFWHNYPDEDSIHLDIRKACNMIIHATDIVIKMGEYYYRERENKIGLAQPNKMYFQGKINITGKSKSNEFAELDLAEFTQHCVELSDRIEAGG